MWLRNLSSEKQPTEIMIKCGFIAVDYDIFSRYISALVPTAYTYLGRHKIGAGRLRRIVSPPNGFFFLYLPPPSDLLLPQIFNH